VDRPFLAVVDIFSVADFSKVFPHEEAVLSYRIPSMGTRDRGGDVP
jgi:hypothetical protein